MTKIPKSNYTQIPNVFFDEILEGLNLAETKVLLAIMRKTFGWQKQIDRISYSQIVKMTGLSKVSISSGIKSLEKKDIIFVIRNGQECLYSVKVYSETGKEGLLVSNEESEREMFNRLSNFTGAGKEGLQVCDKTGKGSLHTKESNINKLSKEIYEEIEKVYESCFYEVKPSGKLFIDYPRTRKRIKELLERITKDEIISVIQNAKTDDWIKDNGFQFSTILSDFQVAKLLNGKPEGRRGYSKPLPVQTRTAFLDMED